METTRNIVTIFIICLLAFVLSFALSGCNAFAGTDEKSFQWEQAAADTISPDFGGWKIYYSSSAEGPWKLIDTVSFTGLAQPYYEKSVSLAMPEYNGTVVTIYFTATAFNKTNGIESVYSNVVSASCSFVNHFSPPFNFRILVQ